MDIRISKIFIPTGETSKSITFQSTQDCDGETLLADLFVIGETVPVARVSSGTEAGKERGERITMDLDFTGVDPGSYSLKIWTSETGVIAKTIVIRQ